MKRSLLVVIASITCKVILAQSTDDVRFTYGEGPFPLYVTGSWGMTSTKSLFRDFVTDYTLEKDADVKYALYAKEINVGSAINCKHCFTIKDFVIKRMAVEMGYMIAQRRMNAESDIALQLVESIGSVRLIYRYSRLYPITFQFHAGLNYYSFYQIREIVEMDSTASVKRLRVGSSLTENHQHKFSRLFPGYNLRFRMAFFDTSGAGSGPGLFFEYSYNGNWKPDNLNAAYEFFGLSTPDGKNKYRNFGRFSMGLVVPLALRIDHRSKY